jgi:hypothetical protein
MFSLSRQLSTHHPDIALAVVSIAGWISKENYGESNLFFKYDISLGHTDASVKHVMESCIAENDAEKHVSNLKVNYSSINDIRTIRIIYTLSSGHTGWLHQF